MKTHNKRQVPQLQRLNEKTLEKEKRQSELYGNIQSLAEMTRPQRKKFLHKLYWEKEMSLHDIERLLGINYSTIRYHFEFLKIPYRNRMEALALGRKQKTNGHSFNWRGGRRLWKCKYWILFKPQHPNCNGNGYIAEHRYVMSEKIGRALRLGEVVHHKDGNKQNNHPDNLQLMFQGGKYKYHGIPVFCPRCNFELKQDSLE